jgi:hypothetical protein
MLLIGASTSLAWSYKEHVLFTRLAVARLLDDPTTPDAMKAWLREAEPNVPDLAAAEKYFMETRVGPNPVGFTNLSYWVCVPDIHANDRTGPKVEPFGVQERSLHFIDLELLLPPEPADRKLVYRHDLSNKPVLSDIPRQHTDPRLIQAGMLPHRIEYCHKQLVQAIQDGKLHAPTSAEQEAKTATYWAGFLAHYVADNTQPHHATVDYKSQTYFANPTRAPNVHAEMEYRMCDDEKNDFMELRKEYWPLFVKHLAEFDDPVQTRDVWQGSVEVSLRSYDALPLIGLAAMKGGKQAGTPEKPEGPSATTAQFDTEAFFRFEGQYLGRNMSVIEMKAIQTAWAVKRIERGLRQAWEEGSATRTPTPE